MSMTISINPALEAKLSRMAVLTKKDIHVVLEDLIAEKLDDRLAFLEAIQEGLDDIVAGRVEDHEDVVKEIFAHIKATAAAARS